VLAAGGRGPAEIVEDGSGVLFLRRRVYLRVVRVDFEPGRAGGEAGVSGVVPLERRAAVVAAGELLGFHKLGQIAAFRLQLLVHVAGFDVLVVVNFSEANVGHAQLIAAVVVGRAAHGEQKRAEQLGRSGAKRGPVVAPAGGHAGLVVVAEVHGAPAFVGKYLVPLRVHVLELQQAVGAGRAHAVLVAGHQAYSHALKMVEHVEFPAGGVHKLQRVGLGHARALGHAHHVVLGQHLAVHFLQVLVQVRAAGVVAAKIAVVLRRNGRKSRVLGDERNHVHPKAVDALIKPEAHHAVNFLAQLGVLPVQVGLLAREVVQVVGLGGSVVGPGVALHVKEALALVGRAFFGGPPVVVVAVGTGARAF